MYIPCSSAMSLCLRASPILISCKNIAPIGDRECSRLILNKICSQILRSLIPFTFLVMYLGPGCGSIPSLWRSRTQHLNACIFTTQHASAVAGGRVSLTRRLRRLMRRGRPSGHGGGHGLDVLCVHERDVQTILPGLKTSGRCTCTGRGTVRG